MNMNINPFGADRQKSIINVTTLDTLDTLEIFYGWYLSLLYFCIKLLPAKSLISHAHRSFGGEILQDKNL
jgi:hypothetical protein